ncbi:hypothetical protein GCM10010443_93150 [Actinoplanes cyaneus]
MKDEFVDGLRNDTHKKPANDKQDSFTETLKEGDNNGNNDG